MPVVADGDCAVSIADQLGFADYHTVWDDGANGGLKGNRPNANQLLAGDDVKAPTAKDKVEKKAVDNTWTFVVKRKKLPKLRIILLDKDNKPLKGKAWRLTSPVAAKGKTKADGLIEIKDLDPQAKNGAITVDWREATKPKKAASPPGPVKKPTYPRPIDETEFKDKNPDAPKPADNQIEWTLKIGSLPHFEDVTGVQSRLHNLGFRCDPEGNAAHTQASVKAFQRTRLKQKNPSGQADEIKTDVRNAHDNP